MACKAAKGERLPPQEATKNDDWSLHATPPDRAKDATAHRNNTIEHSTGAQKTSQDPPSHDKRAPDRLIATTCDPGETKGGPQRALIGVRAAHHQFRYDFYREFERSTKKRSTVQHFGTGRRFCIDFYKGKFQKWRL